MPPPAKPIEAKKAQAKQEAQPGSDQRLSWQDAVTRRR